ncbi:hypothetical protein [Glycomyces tenuis]|uniref:hypothetical protein n=1 Tax=Glycomyces tenuis TaxID=58116 RepID=UPI0012DCA1B6|nr:hypothetical protein [Glycomyces tenuis]
MLLADPAPGPVGLGARETVYADAEQPARHRPPVEVGVEPRDRDAVEVDVAQSLVKREIGELRELAGIP